uniref:Tetratricopeptide repeat protein 39C n=2 Tax=Cacopsylla melanoneura TaxID=428564 RepID=A0A8D9AGD6_9HEMI
MNQQPEMEEQWEVARRGILLVLHNRYQEAEALFKSGGDSAVMAAGSCFIGFMSALMTFEEDKLNECMTELRALERRCAGEIGWLKSMRNKVFGESTQCLTDRLETQIILADTQVSIAILTFLQQDIAGYVKGGWTLRKAWKVYQHTYQQILGLYKRAFQNPQHAPLFLNCDLPTWSQPPPPTPCQEDNNDWSVPSSLASTPTSLSPKPLTHHHHSFLKNPLAAFFGSHNTNGQQSTNECPIPADTIARLLGAISFGYGTFQLCMSLLPPSMLKLIHFLGFTGDRSAGVEALMFCKQSRDMRAPLATLTLLWYHTIVRPFFSQTGHFSKASLNAAKILLDDNDPEFGTSAFFLFFQGRVCRLQSNIPGAIQAFQGALEKSPQREVQLLCLHEIGWCYLASLSYVEAFHSFNILKKRSRWSKYFYTYLTLLCLGALDNRKELDKFVQSFLSLQSDPSNYSTNQLDDFVQKRLNKLLDTFKVEPQPIHFKMFVYELLYLWSLLASATPITIIVQDCLSCDGEEPMLGLSKLILGASLNILNRKAEALTALESVLLVRKDLPSTAPDAHITAFALYEMGIILIENYETQEEGRACLLKIQSSFKNFDFESRLSVRIHGALRSLEE